VVDAAQDCVKRASCRLIETESPWVFELKTCG
jgi:hypothetical protein